MNIFEKIKFILRRPKVIIVTGEGRACAKEAIFQVLKQYFKVDKEILLFETELKNSSLFEKFNYLVKTSSLPILVVTQVGDIPFEQDFFAGDREKTIQVRKLAKTLPTQGHLILNFDDETVREIKDYDPPTTPSHKTKTTFGFQEGADFRVTDIKLNTGTNFKINYKGNIVPVWLEKLFGKEQIYSALAAASVGIALELNLVEISQALKNYQSLPGKMRLIEGIKDTSILDHSQSATVFSMAEAIEILGKTPGFKRKIAILGDIVGIGKYTPEAHQVIGEKVVKNADLLFTFGLRAKFIARGAIQKGMAPEKIFQFDTIEEGRHPPAALLKLQEEIKEGDLILVDGSKEMEMEKIVEEIKALE